MPQIILTALNNHEAEVELVLEGKAIVQLPHLQTHTVKSPYSVWEQSPKYISQRKEELVYEGEEDGYHVFSSRHNETFRVPCEELLLPVQA